ncbi:magnesium transporter [Acuticoccus mangrovi]|uniref:Magnesium transporter n=1 Tax=Acuticoccus mangrovi TaxID=2796142 RepID=A0A934MIG3_9HYPH|nr:magnesium transporter [Acuticoccus mangrovi]MBJ3778738.1 magnesium transporter [Acuticoccus mangrovi]
MTSPNDPRDIDALAAAAPDEAARRLRRLPRRERAAAAARIGRQRRDEVLALADHDEGTAGALMTSRYADLSPETSVGEALRLLGEEHTAETIYRVFLVDADFRLVGAVELRDLIAADRKAKVGALAETDPPRATLSESDVDAARRLLQSRLPAMPVVDDEGTLVGIITADDAQRCLAEATDEDTDRFTAINHEEGDDDYLAVPLLAEIRRRAPWILGLAAAGLMAGYIVHVYEDALNALVILALYMPMVADTGGNVGTQSASLVLRAVATGRVRLGDTLRVVRKEVCIGLALAALLFLFALLKVVLLSNGADVPAALTLTDIALAIGVAISVAVFVSVLIGALLPLAAVAIRVDPAVFAGPALTTIVDVVGLFLYFQITTRMLGVQLVS